MITDRVPCRKYIQEVPVWIKFTTNVVVLMCTKSLSLPAFDAARSRKYEMCIRDSPEAHASYALIWDKNHKLSHVASEFIEHIKAAQSHESSGRVSGNGSTGKL